MKELVFTIKYTVSAERVEMEHILDHLRESGKAEIIDVDTKDVRPPKKASRKRVQ
jgi:hypothetical protein